MVEFAITLPMLFLIIFGSIQIANALYTQQFLTEVCYQGALQGMSPFSDESSIEATMNDILNSRNISGAQIELTGLDGTTPFESLSSGSPFIASVTLSPTSTYGGPMLVQIIQMESSASGIKQ